MDALILFVVLAVTVEAVVEYGKTILEHENKKELILQLTALAAAVLLCCAARADAYQALGISFESVPFIGYVLTGIFASRGANYASDILSRLQKTILK